MRILTRSRRIKRAVQAALARIPAKDRQTIMSFVTWVRVDTAWRLVGLVEVQQSAAELLPLYEREAPFETERGKPPTGQIIFLLPVCRLFSDKALIGIAAHE